MVFQLQRTQALQHSGPISALYVTSCTSTSQYICSNGVGEIFVLTSEGELQFKIRFGDSAVWSLIVVKDDSRNGEEVVVAGNSEGKIGIFSLSDG
jgi:hypothetical protein